MSRKEYRRNSVKSPCQQKIYESETEKAEKEIELAKRKLEPARIMSEINAIENVIGIKLEREMMQIKKEIITVENIPLIADALSGVFKNSQVSFYGGVNPLLVFG